MFNLAGSPELLVMLLHPGQHFADSSERKQPRQLLSLWKCVTFPDGNQLSSIGGCQIGAGPVLQRNDVR
jgi:hypothetical protein